MKILCIGNCTYDITFPVESFIKENTKNNAFTKIECGGGSTANAAALLGSWGMSVYFAGIIGNDYYGKKIKDEFNKYGVNTKYLQMSNEFNTKISNIIVNKENASRTILSYKPSTMKMKDFDLEFEPDIILIDGQEYDISKKLLKKYSNAISVIDAGIYNEKTIELASLTDFLICSLDFAEKTTNIKFDLNNIQTISSIYTKLKAIFNNKIIITLGENGTLYEKDKKIKIMKSISVDSIDTTGAGDIFHGAFIYAVANKMNLESVIKLSNITAALSTKKYSGRLSIPTKEEVKEKLSEYR